MSIVSCSCPVCNYTAEKNVDHDRDSVFYHCPICGRFQFANVLEGKDYKELDFNRLSSYLFYHRYLGSFENPEYRYNTTLAKEICDGYRKEFDKGQNTNGRPVHMDNEIINSWYPKTFDERIDKILVELFNKTEHVGKAVVLTPEEGYSLLFIDRKTNSKIPQWRNQKDLNTESDFILDYLKQKQYAEWKPEAERKVGIRLLPEGYSRVEIIQKYSSSGRNVVVAMKFGDDTKNLREAIRKGIEEAGFHAIFIDEVQHNDFITPELLKHIKESKFLVVDLTHKNNGAYFEEGYAMGLGKEVIQLCKEGISLHFDVAQKNTIIWEKEDDIPKRLFNRIKATID